jgi:hypothetical protein
MSGPDELKMVPSKIEDHRESTVGDMIRIENELNQRTRIVARVHEILNSNLDPENDVDFVHNKPCRNKNAARKAFRIFGGKFEYLKDGNGHPILIRKDYNDKDGQFYTYECYGKYFPPFGLGDVVEASGMFSSRDKFFGTVSGEIKDISEIDEANVRQAAQTECFKKCIFLGLGLTDLIEGELKKLGVDTDKSGGHRGEVKGKKGGSQDTDADRELRGEIERMCHEMFKSGLKSEKTGKPFSAPEAVLKEVTTSDNWRGWDSFSKITTRGLKITHENVTAAHKKAYEGFTE